MALRDAGSLKDGMIHFMNLASTSAWGLMPWPPQPDLMFWIALTLVCAALLGHLVHSLFALPRVLGYGAMGVALAALGPGEAGLQGTERLIVDLALAVLLFELGSRVPLGWLRANRVLLLTSLLESALGYGAVFAVLRIFGFTLEVSLAGAAVLGTSAGALSGRISAELRSAGQVTDRMLVLSALNTLYSVLLLKLLGGSLHISNGDWIRGLSEPIYTFAGAVVVAALLARAVNSLLRRADLREENPVLMILGLLLLSLTVARMFNLSTLLVPLLGGVLLRNGSERPCIWPRHFGTAGGALVLLMFVVVGATWSWAAMVAGGLVAAALLTARFGAKALVLVSLARFSGIRMRQGAALALCLSPISATVLVLQAELQNGQPAVAAQLAPVVLAALGITILLGPILILLGLRWAKESHS